MSSAMKNGLTNPRSERDSRLYSQIQVAKKARAQMRKSLKRFLDQSWKGWRFYRPLPVDFTPSLGFVSQRGADFVQEVHDFLIRT
ncbi:hypothetical protein IAD21_06236 [Abditibacteriota bacterium]|nr:hypothetical protein IAD21_06236 [Abditibacteriota bacterium]